MATGGRMPMPTDAAILTLAQWFSPAYPVGSFAYSHGLEWAIEAEEVTDAATLEAWVGDVLEHGAGRADATFLAAAYHAPDVARVHVACRAFAASRERLQEAELQGAAFAETTARIWGIDLPSMAYPVAVGRAARLCDLPVDLTAQMYLKSFSSALVSVGMRLIPLGQTEGQAVIARLTPLCQRIAGETEVGDLDSIASSAFLADVAAMKHETQYSRVFRT